MTILAKWQAENAEEHGHYAMFAGFEAAIRGHSELMQIAYDEMGIYEQIELFVFVTGLLEKEGADELRAELLERAEALDGVVLRWGWDNRALVDGELVPCIHYVDDEGIE